MCTPLEDLAYKKLAKKRWSNCEPSVTSTETSRSCTLASVPEIIGRIWTALSSLELDHSEEKSEGKLRAHSECLARENALG